MLPDLRFVHHYRWTKGTSRIYSTPSESNLNVQVEDKEY